MPHPWFDVFVPDSKIDDYAGGILANLEAEELCPDVTTSENMVPRNRTLFEEARRLGSKHYTISAIPLSQQDWIQHFQPFWGKLVIAKHSFDPDNILTPGPGIFADNNIEAR